MNEKNIAEKSQYPVRFHVEYSSRLSRVTTLFRIILALPILALLAVVGYGVTISAGSAHIIFGGGGILFLGPALMIIFRKKYPRWMFDWNANLLSFVARISAYLHCLTDDYPDTEKEQKVKLEIDYPNVALLSRWLPIVKWILAIPHYIALAILSVIGVFALIIGWFSILVVGHYPKPLFDYLVGVSRWYWRVVGYAFLMVTDQYPPFTLK